MGFGEIKRGRKISSGKFYLIIFVGTILLSLFLTERVYIISLEKKVIDIKKQREKISSEITNLKIDAADLRKGSRIKTIAVDSLGLIMPEGAPEKLF
jgi:cell division protein FtsL